MRYITGVVFAIAAFFLVMMCMPETGAIYTHDSKSYEYAAFSLLETGRMVYFGYDTPIIQWPPLYILAAAVMKLFKVPFANGAACLNGTAFALLICASGFYLFKNLDMKWLTVPALILMVVCVPLVFVTGYAWTEMLFIFLSVLSMMSMLHYIKREEPAWLYASAIVSSLCWLTRYAGIAMISVSVLVLFIRAKPFSEKIKKTFIYLVISILPMSAWVIRNHRVSGTFTGGRQAGNHTLAQNIQLSLSVFNEWSSYAIPPFMYISAVLFVFLIILALSLQKDRHKKPGKSPPDLAIHFLYIVFYAAILLASATKAAMDPINSRLWSPVYPFWVFTLTLVSDKVLRNVKTEKAKGWLAAGFTLVALVVTINPAIWIRDKGFSRKEARLGLKESVDSIASPALKLVRETLKPGSNTLVISNDAAVLATHTDHKCFYPPKKNSIPIYSFSQYRERIANYQKVYLVWSGRMESDTFMAVSAFREAYEMEKIAQNNNCVIYLIKR